MRFINRPADSGTRFLLEGLLGEAQIAGTRIAGFEQSEATHASVAAFVASGLADAGFGLERPARYFQLDFIPMVNERYFLICHEATLQHPVMQKTLAILADPEFKQSVNALPGYDSTHSGQVQPLREAFAMNVVHASRLKSPARRRHLPAWPRMCAWLQPIPNPTTTLLPTPR